MSDAGRRSTVLRLLLPLGLLAGGWWLLTGCFYLPLPEHRVDSSQPDFREMFQGNGKKPPQFRVDSVTRAQVEKALGPPPFFSTDERVIGYLLQTQGGVWVWPLCFQATPAKVSGYALRLEFDEHDVLSAWKISKVERSVHWFNGNPDVESDAALELLNRVPSGPRLNRRLPPEDAPSPISAAPTSSPCTQP